jgi:hypothetical protein
MGLRDKNSGSPGFFRFGGGVVVFWASIEQDLASHFLSHLIHHPELVEGEAGAKRPSKDEG